MTDHPEINVTDHESKEEDDDVFDTVMWPERQEDGSHIYRGTVFTSEGNQPLSQEEIQNLRERDVLT